MAHPAVPRVAGGVAGALVGAWATALAVNRSLRDVDGESMAPTLGPGARIAVVPRRVAPLRRGDVVIVRDPREPGRTTVKRLIGLPGELVEVRGGRLTIDGLAYLEGYVTARVGEAVAVLGDEQVFVMGDNRAGSTDSRAYGPVTIDLVEAVAVALVRPRVRVGLRVEPWPLSPTHRAD